MLYPLVKIFTELPLESFCSPNKALPFELISLLFLPDISEYSVVIAVFVKPKTLLSEAVVTLFDKPEIILCVEEIIVFVLPFERVFVLDELALLSPNVLVLLPLDSTFDFPEMSELVFEVELFV